MQDTSFWWTEPLRERNPWGWRKLLSSVLSFVIALSGFWVVPLAVPATATAAPVLSVSMTATSRPVLGGTATFRVTVRNSGDAKAYNISVSQLFGSTLANPNGRMAFINASDGGGTLSPTSEIASPTTTGDTRLDFANLKDLEANETYSFDVEVDTADDPSWVVGSSILCTATATGFSVPDGTGPLTPATASAAARLVPIKVVTKTAQQSTGVEQATGTQDRTYHYTVRIQNNYVGTTTGTVVTDRIPDGVEFLGVTSGPAPSAISTDVVTGIKTLTWNLGDVAAGQAISITYRAGIRYDWFGTANGGTNRDHSDFTTPSAIATSAIVPDKTPLGNFVDLIGNWQGLPATDSAAATVTAAYLTVAKAIDRGTGGNETTVTYTLTPYASQYYDILSEPTGTIVLHDRVPDGQTYLAGSASSTPDTVTVNPDGTTDLYWNLPTIPHSTHTTVSFKAIIDYEWEGGAFPPGESVVAGDSMVNTCDIDGTYEDLVRVDRPLDQSTSAARAGFSTTTPKIYKHVRDPETGAWTTGPVTGAPGDTFEFRVRFNTTNGVSAEETDIKMGDIRVTDWLPPGMTYNGDATVHSAGPGSFVDPAPSTPPALNITTPTTTAIGGLQGIEWYLGDVAKAGWWEATFTASLVTATVVADGTRVNNLWKMTGVNSAGAAYSDRAMVPIEYTEPELTIAKSLTPTPTPVLGGTECTFTVLVTNTGTAPARDVLVTDALPIGMRQGGVNVIEVWHSTQGVLAAAPAPGAGYRVFPAFDGATGTFGIDLEDAGGSIDTSLPAGETLRVTYRARVDHGVAAGLTMTNSASVSGASQPAGGDQRRYTAGPASVTLTAAGLTVSKSGPAGTWTFGQPLTYNATVTVPTDTVAYWPKLIDTINQDGFAYVPGTATLTDVSGSPVTPAAFDGTSTPYTERASINNDTRFVWHLRNSIDNSGSASPYVFRLSFQVVPDGLEGNGTSGSAWELAPPTASYAPQDRVRGHWTTTSLASRPASATPTNVSAPYISPSSAQSNAVNTTVGQPIIRTTKTVAGSGPFFGTAVAGYQVVLSNIGTTPAYDLSLSDVLPSRIDSATLVSVRHSVLGTLTAGVDYTADFSALPTATVVFAPAVSLATTHTITVRYDGRVVPSIASGAAITNLADADWSSRPGAPTGVRIYNDSAREAYTGDTTSTTIFSPSPTITKSLTSAISTATVGDEFAYRIRVDVPFNTTLYSTVVTDTVPDGLEVVSVDASPLLGLPPIWGARTAAGTPIVWDLSAVALTNPPLATLDMTVTVRVADTFAGGSPVDGWPVGVDGTPQTSWVNRGGVRWLDAALGSTLTSQTAPTPAVTAVAPRITTSKSASVTTASAGQNVRWTARITNGTGTSTAYDLVWNDDLPQSLVGTPTLVGVQLVGSGSVALIEGVDYQASFSEDTATVTFARPLPAGEQFVITFDTEVRADVRQGQIATNTMVTSGASTQPGAHPHERIIADTTSTATVALVSPGLVVAKIGPGDTTLQRGQTATFTVTVRNVGGGAAHAVIVTDTLPADLTLVPGSTSASWPGGSSSADPIVSGSHLAWNLDAELPASDTLMLTYAVTVDAAASSGSRVNVARATATDALGSAVPADTSAWIAADTDHDDTASSPFAITRPGLSGLKARVVSQDTTIQVGQSVGFDLVVTNSGDTTLTAVDITDTYDATTLRFGSASTPAHSVGGGVLSWGDLGPLAPGATTTITVDFVALSVPAGATTVNSLTVHATDENGDVPPAVASSATVDITDPALSVTKRLASGQDAYVQPGEPVTFDIGVRNTGDTTITAAAAFDEYDASRLTFFAATMGGVDLPGIVLWPTLGTLAPGDEVTVSATFIAGAPSGPTGTADLATVLGVDHNGDSTIPATDTATAWVTQPDVTVHKARSVGQDAHVQAGEPVSFDVVVTNSGDTTLAAVPLTDTFEPACLAFEWADSAPSTIGASILGWDNVGPLVPGESTTVTVTFKALVAPANNITTDTAEVRMATDVHGDVAADASSSAAVAVTRPHVSVVKARVDGQDAHIQAGQVVGFNLVVTNTGDTTLEHVPLSDTFDADVLGYTTSTVPAAVNAGTLDFGDVGPLAVGDSTTVTVTFTALSAPAGHTTVDTATVDSATDINGDRAASVVVTQTIAVTRPAVSVTKSRSNGQDGFIQVGETATFDIVVSNSGDTTLTSLALTDDFDESYLAYATASPAAIDIAGTAAWSTLPTLAPGETTTVSVSYTAVAVPQSATSADTATVSATDLNGDAVVPGVDTDDIAITRPGVHVVKSLSTDQDPHVQVGETVMFDVVVVNNGTTEIATLPLSDRYDPAELTFIGSAPAAVSPVPGRLDWPSVGPLAAGETTTITVSFTAASVPASGAALNAAVVDGATDVNGDPVPVTTDDAVVGITGPAATVSKTLSAGQDTHIQPGEPVTFDIVVRNSGTTTITALPLVDEFEPSWLSFTSASTAPASVTATSVTFAQVAPLAPGEQTTVSVTFTAVAVPPSRTTPDVASTLEGLDANSDRVPPASDIATIAITAPDVTLTKRLATGQDPQVQVGQSVGFELRVTNTGDTTLTAVPVTDSFDPARLRLDASTVPTAAQTSSSATWHLGPLSPGRVATIGVTFTAVGNDASHVTINSAETSAIDEFGDHTPSVRDTDTVAITHPHVSVDKTIVGRSVVALGDEVTYRVRVTNDGDTTLETVALTDEFDQSHLEFVGAHQEPDTVGSDTLSWTDLTGPGSLAVGSSIDTTVTFKVTHEGTGIANVATVSTATDLFGDPTNVPSATVDTLVGTRPELSIAKRLVLPSNHSVPVGSDAVYEIVVTNTGDTTMTTIPLTDVFDSSMALVSSTPTAETTDTTSLSIADLTGTHSLAPGDSVVATITLRALAETPSAVDTATVAGAVDSNGDTPRAVRDADGALSVFDPDHLALLKSAVPGTGAVVEPGSVVRYTVAVVNSSTVTVPDVLITDPVPAGTSYVAESMSLTLNSADTSLTDAADADAGTLLSIGATPTVSVLVGALAPGQSATLSFSVVIGPEEQSRRGIVNTASATSGAFEVLTSLPVYHNVDPLLLTKTGADVNGGKLKSGDVIEWSIELVNDGIVPATNVRITDTIPAHTTYVAGSIAGIGATDAGAPDLVWEIGELAPGARAIVTFRSRVNAGLPSGTTIRNQATATADQSPAKHSDSPSTSAAGDPTLLQTGNDERLWIVLAGLALLMGGWMFLRGRRRRA